MLWNTNENGTPLGSVMAIMRRALPPRWEVDLQQEVLGLNGFLRLQAPDGTRGAWAVEVKQHLEPRAVREVVEQARSMTNEPVLVVASFLSEETRRRLVEQGVSYADATGNIRLVLERPALFIEMEGARKNPAREDRPLHSLKGRGAGRVVRALCDFKPPYGVRELIARAELPIGTTSRVIDLLAREALLVRDPKGRVLVAEWMPILRRWAQDAHFLKVNGVAQYFEPRGLQVLTGKLRSLPTDSYCATGSMAAVVRAPIAPPRLALIYAANVDAVAHTLNLKRVESNGNVLLIQPATALPFERTWTSQGVSYAALTQVAADLMNSPGRGPAEAEALLDWMKDHEDEWRA